MQSLGAGGLGVCTAFGASLIEAILVDLYEENNGSVKKASLMSKRGNYHLANLCYGSRTSTAAKENDQWALHFISYLKDGLKSKSMKTSFPNTFYYGVPYWFIDEPGEVSVHYQRCSEYFTRLRNHFKKDYLDLFESLEVSRLQTPKSENIAIRNTCLRFFQNFRYAVESKDNFRKTHRSGYLPNPNVNLFLNTKNQLAVSDHGK